MEKKNGGKTKGIGGIVKVPNTNLVKDGKIMETTEQKVETKAEPRQHFTAVQAYGFTADQIAEQVTAGNIANVGLTRVNMSEKATKGAAEFVTYEKLIALTFAGQAFFTGGKEEPKT